MPDRDGWLTKSEINAVYYDAVAGAVGFGTEAQAGLHSAAVARMVALQARGTGKPDLRILELGANNGGFARSLLDELRGLVRTGASDLTRVDYLAVESSRPALEAAIAWEGANGSSDSVLLPAGQAQPVPGVGVGTLVGLLRRSGPPLATNLGLVHADALDYVRRCSERFDVAILNELLDDLPWSVAFRDVAGPVRELVTHSRLEASTWVVRIDAPVLGGQEALELPAGSLTARSSVSVALVEGLAAMLDQHGILLVHDYGIAGPFVDVAAYEQMPRLLPAFARLEFPAAATGVFPRSFFRVFGDEDHRVVQITNDVNFEELARPLRAAGTVIVLPHGSALTSDPGFAGFARDDGVFLSEFGLLPPDDDLGAVLARLEREQRRMRDRYVRDHAAGRESMFLDLVYLKS